MKILAPALVDMSREIGADAIRALAIGNVEVTKVLVPALVDASRGIGSDAAIAITNGNVEIAKAAVALGEKGIVVLGVVGVVAVTIYGVTQLQPIAKDTYEFIYPTDQQKEEATAARARIAFYEARANLGKCFMGSTSNSERNNVGYPTTCEEKVRMLIMCGGETEADRMVAGFKKYW